MTLIIRTCRHILPYGRHCRGAAVRGRACCRHHLDAQTRFHNMARARRLTCIPRLRVPTTPRDLALNRAEVLRVLATGHFDFATARMMLRAMQLSDTGLRAQYHQRLRATHISAANSNKIYQVPASPLSPQGYAQNPSQLTENTRAARGYPQTSQPDGLLGSPTRERVGFLQARRAAISKPSASALGKRVGR